MKNDVSLWLGFFEDFDAVEKYTEVTYDEDGDSIPSAFEKEFTVGYYDRDVIEKDWIPDAENDIKTLLAGFSYDDQLIRQFKDFPLNARYNTILLVYNYNHHKEETQVASINERDYKVDFIGTAEYTD